MKLNKYLEAAQALQAKAINRNDIKMFEVEIRHYEDEETSLWVTTRHMDVGKHNYFTFYTFWSKEENDSALAKLKAWLGE